MKIDINEGKGIEYLRKAAFGGIVEANYLIGKNILEKKQEITEKEKREAVGEIEYAAREGSVEAKYYLGELKVEGKYVDQNKEKGRELIKEAAEAGYYKAQYKLGKLYYEDKPAIHCQKGILWLEAAINTSRIDAIKGIGEKYNVFAEVRDEASLKGLYHKISLKVHPDSHSGKCETGEARQEFENLVKLYQGKFTNEDIARVINYDLYNDTEYMIGEMYYEGCLDLKKDLGEAEQWYKKGGENGNELALYKSYEVYEESSEVRSADQTQESTEL